MSTRFVALGAALAALLAAAPAAPAQDDELDFRTVTISTTIVHEVQSEGGQATVRLRTPRPTREGILVYARPGKRFGDGPPPVQFQASGTAKPVPGTLSGPGCETRTVRSRLHYAVEGAPPDQPFRFVVQIGRVAGLDGFCGTPSGFERDTPRPVPLTGLGELRRLRVGRSMTARGTLRHGTCPEDCTTTTVTLRIRRVD